jgi:DNA-binding MarR family transcriptional regulator
MAKRSVQDIDDYPLFSIRARRTHPPSSHADCQRQNRQLSDSMIYALQWIHRYPGRTAKELESLAECTPGQIWKVVAQLERRGYIYRRRDGSKPMKIYPN